ncbi:MAG: methyltransferase domain-containing protein [Chlamydiia bacterium]|nr:methyltransferase domain-containing protein [Chlamydiia bacterium]
MKKGLIFGLFCFCVLTLSAFEIDRQTGIWSGLDSGKFHRHDTRLCAEFVKFFQAEEAKTIVDFGCGMGSHVRAFKNKGFITRGFDGNPDTPELTKGLCEVLDLTIPHDLKTKFDWVVSLEVGEHVPRPFEKIFVENLVRHAEKGIILSWAPKGQRGKGHFNEQNNDYVKELLQGYGFTPDLEAEQRFRENSDRYWFKNSIMVFRRA